MNPKPETPRYKHALGVVSFLNARPLIAGLESRRDVELLFDVPARLPELLETRRVHAALVPVIDLVERGDGWQIVSDACIGCDGETLTVRIFSRVPPEEIRRLHVDGDSHTSVALARIIWRETYARSLEIIPFSGGETVDECEAVLLIGDKVVTNRLIDYPIEIDLGAGWKSLTSLPFVFAVWAAPRGSPASQLAGLLSAARDLGEQTAEMIAADFGPGMGWSVTLAKRYLTARLKFRLGPRQRLGIAKFCELANRNDLLSSPREPVFT